MASMELPPCLKPASEGCELWVQVVPNASRTAIAGLHDGALRVRLMAPAIEGRANAAMVDWLAAELNLPRRAVTLMSGERQRRKRFLLRAPVASVADWLSGG